MNRCVPFGQSRFLSLHIAGGFFLVVWMMGKDMDKAEIQQIVAVLHDIYEGICEGDEATTVLLHLMELHRIIERLMDATSATDDQHLKVLLASIEYKVRQYKRAIEDRLGTRN